MKAGRYRYGAQNPAAKLSEEQVRQIKALLARGAGYRFLAGRYGVSTQTIGAIARGQAWRHVPDPLPPSLARAVREWRAVCRHTDVPYARRVCPRCGAEFEACPVCAGALCEECEKGIAKCSK